MSDLLKGLNPEQIKAVQHFEGPALILAGAGSGKTKALVHRVAYLHEVQNIGLDNILAITFTNKAAAEMKERVMHLLGTKQNLNVSTFHAFCARLLRREAGQIGFSNSFTIIDANDQLSAMKKIMEGMQVDTKKIYPEAVRNAISSAKNELITPEQYAGLASGALQQTVAQVYPAYQKILKDAQSMDFDDLIMFTVQLFSEHPEVLQKYQNQFRFLLIDEYQDTNTAQYTLANLLAEAHRNIFVVGDDWQSIYSWRGANYENILNFNRDYPDAQVIKLEQNYRSTQNILDAAHSIIENNRNRSEKKLWTNADAGEPITIYEALNGKDEVDFVLRKIIAHRAHDDAKLSDFVVLYRTNAQSRSVEEGMLRANIPYRVVGGVKFYDRKEIKDMLAFITILANPENNIAVDRVINVPARGIGKKTYESLEDASRAAGLCVMDYLDSHHNLTASAQEFVSIINSLRESFAKNPLSKLIDVILATSGYRAMLMAEGIEGETRLENIYELKSVMEKYDHLPPREAVTVFLEEVSLISDLDAYAGDEAVTLMTIHTAKGLEFKYVFVVGMEENLFPHSRSLFDQSELEEERRLAYVAITRAKKIVYLISAKERLIYGSLQNNPPSRFLNDIPEELCETTYRHIDSSSSFTTVKSEPTRTASSIQPGMKVIHKQFGVGTVIAKAGDIITVAFVNEGIKNLVAELADLTVKA